MMSARQSRTTTHCFRLNKYSQGRMPIAASGKSQPHSSNTDADIQWQHFSKPALFCNVIVLTSDTLTASDANTGLTLKVEWRLGGHGAQDASSQSQSGEADEEGGRMVLENLDLGAFSTLADSTDVTSRAQKRAELPLKAVYKGCVVGLRYQWPLNGDGSQYRRFQMKFTSEDDAASFIRLVQVVCPVAPAPNSGAMAKPSPVSGAGTADVLAMTQIAHIDEENSQLAIRSLAGAERVQQLDPSLPFPSSTPTMLAATPLTSSPHMAIPRTPFPHLTSATVPAVSSGDVRLGSRPQSNVARQGSGVSVDTQTAGKRPLPEQDAATKAPAKKPRARAPPKAKVPAKGKRKNKPLDLAPAASADTQEHAVQAVVSRSPSRQTPAPAQLQLQAQPVESHTQRSATITQSIPTSRSAQGQLVLQPQPLENYGAFTSNYNRSGMGPNVHHDSSGGLNFTHELPTQYYPVARSYVATRSAAQPSPATLQPSQGPADQLQNGALRYHQPHPHSDQAQMYESHSSRACATTSSVRELFAMSDRELEETATRIMLDEGFPEVVERLARMAEKQAAACRQH